MTIEIILVFGILLTAIVLFFTGWVRMDIVALFVLTLLAATGVVTPQDALSGFSNPAVITVWSMFILSASLYYTGVARLIGKQMLYLVGHTEWRVILVIMLTAGILSSVINNIGVAAMLLPVVMDISRQTGRSPSRLLLPLAFATHLGGLTTLIGSPPNLLISVKLEAAGFGGLGLLDFTPLGVGVMVGGIVFAAFVGRRFLPRRLKEQNPGRQGKALTESYHLSDSTFLIRIAPGSMLVGKTLSESKLRPALGLNVLSVKSEGGATLLNPGPDILLRTNDKLFVQGSYDLISSMQGWKTEYSQLGPSQLSMVDWASLNIFEIRVKSHVFRKGLAADLPDMNLLATVRNGSIETDNLNLNQTEDDDVWLVQYPDGEEGLKRMAEESFIKSWEKVSARGLLSFYGIGNHIFFIKTIESAGPLSPAAIISEIYHGLGFRVMAMGKPGKPLRAPLSPAVDTWDAGMVFLVFGDRENLQLLEALTLLELPDEAPPVASSLEDDDVILAEVVLSPRSVLSGKTLSEINFRKRFGLTVLALWREGKACQTHIHTQKLRFGEALLLYGKREKVALIGSEPDFILLTETLGKPLRTHKALTALGVMLVVLLPVLLGYLPIAISSVAGVALMVVTGCLKMEEAYQSIEWRSVFLIAGMLPLGIAMQQTGAAEVLAVAVESVFGGFGKYGMVAGFYLMTVILTLALHPAAIVVFLSPVALQTAVNYGISPHSLMLAMSFAASASFLSPVSHPANLLVMGPGGYRFSDYIKFGLPLTLVVMVIVMVLLPVLWPL